MLRWIKTQLNAKIDKNETNFNARLDLIEKNLSQVNNKIAVIEIRLSDISTNVTYLMWHNQTIPPKEQVKEN